MFQTQQYHTDLRDALQTAQPKYKPLSDNEILTAACTNITLYQSVMLGSSEECHQCLEELDMYFQVQSRSDSSTLNMEGARSSETPVPL